MANHYFEYKRFLLGSDCSLGVFSLILLAIVSYSTWSGMDSYIAASRIGGGYGSEPSLGVNTVVFFVSVALVILMWFSLRETFRPRRNFLRRLLTLSLYLLLVLWSVGFSYGFWWTIIAGTEIEARDRSEYAKVLRDRVIEVKAASVSLAHNLESAENLARNGVSDIYCNNIGGAEGNVEALSALIRDIHQNFLKPIEGSVDPLLNKILEAATALNDGRGFGRAVRSARESFRNILAVSSTLGPYYRGELLRVYKEIELGNSRTRMRCYDPLLLVSVNELSQKMNSMLALNIFDDRVYDDPAGAAAAVGAFWKSIQDYLLTLPSWFNGKEMSIKTRIGGSVTQLELVAFVVTISTSLGLLAVTTLNIPPDFSEDIAVEVRRAVVVSLSRTSDKGTDRAKDLEWLKKHFVHHRSSVYFVVPNISSCLNKEIIQGAELEELAQWAEWKGEIPKREKNQLSSAPSGSTDLATLKDTPQGPREQLRQKLISELLKEVDEDEAQNGQALNLLAAVLVDLRLIKIMTLRELFAARKEEQRESLFSTDFDRVGNHGILFKARQALKNTGWSRHARKDAEIYRLLGRDGFSPFLRALNKAARY